MINRSLRHYRIQARLGEGGMGVVYRALDTHLDRPVAIKVLNERAVASPERRKRFVQEAKAASALNHPNIVTIYDIDTVDGIDFIAMEFVPGKTLDAVIAHHPLALREVLKYAIQMADALSRAHSVGISHRDLKPANIMATPEGLIKILDFGLAKLTEAAGGDDLTATQKAHLTEEGSILGTAAYMSPEQAEGREIDGRSDIFSLGSILYEMVTGRRAFAGETKMSTLSAVLRAEPRPVAELAPGLPHEIERIIGRCLKKDRDRRFQQMAEVKLALEELKEESESGKLAPAGATPTRRFRAIYAIVPVLALAAAAGLLWWGRRPKPEPAPPTLTRLTADSGWTADPAISPDGKLLAYASDRAGNGNLDIWLQHLAGGDPIRLTTDAADESEPSFSPDGGRIVFRSERDGGGIYVMPVLGGTPKLVVRHGLRPRFSPDGAQIAYWMGARGATPGATDRTIFVVGASGGASLQLCADFVLAANPVWSPDGKHILFLGRRSRSQSDNAEWWVVPASGGEAIPTGALEVWRAKGNLGVPPPPPGTWTGNFVYFSHRQGYNANLWRVPISADRKVSKEFERLTFGTALEEAPSISTDGQLVFTSAAFSTDVWYMPLDANQGKVTGERKRITQDAALDLRPSISRDGKKLVFASNRTGNFDIWLRDLDTGKETNLTSTPADELDPAISADGTTVSFYSRGAPGKVPTFVVPASGGVAEKIYEGRFSNWSISASGSTVLGHGGRAIDTGSREVVEIVKDPKFQVLSPSFSPDDRWIAVHVRNAELTRRLYVLPYRKGQATPESEWIPVSDGKELDRDPAWSPNGNLLYFNSERDGARCIWAQRLEPATKHPASTAFPVAHFHDARISLQLIDNSGLAGPAVGEGKLVFVLGERTGNIWMTRVK